MCRYILLSLLLVPACAYARFGHYINNIGIRYNFQQMYNGNYKGFGQGAELFYEKHRSGGCIRPPYSLPYHTVSLGFRDNPQGSQLYAGLGIGRNLLYITRYSRVKAVLSLKPAYYFQDQRFLLNSEIHLQYELEPAGGFLGRPRILVSLFHGSELLSGHSFRKSGHYAGLSLAMSISKRKLGF